MDTFTGATLHKYAELKFELKEYELRKPVDTEVLVKVMSSTINPSDMSLINGLYGKTLPELPRIMGGEGSGIVVDVGDKANKDLIGKHVGLVASSAVSKHGVWAQYAYADERFLFVFEKPHEFDKICGTYVNPFTVVGFLDTVLKSGKKSVAQNGASTALGRMFLKLCVSQGIEIINIVRKESSIEELKAIGGKHFVNAAEEGWVSKLKELSEELDVTILFDCCGGDITGKCLSGIKSGGTVYNFGNLEHKPLGGFSSKDFIFEGKSVKGWWLPVWISTTDLKTVLSYKQLIVDDFDLNEGKIFSTTFKESFALSDIEKAIGVYTTTSGKILLKPWGI